MNLKINQIVLYGLLLRVINAFYVGFIDDSVTSGDSSSFHFTAVNEWYDLYRQRYPTFFQRDSILIDGSRLYITFLKIIYNLTIPHIFIGCLFSCFAWFLSAKILINISAVLKMNERSQKLALIFYSFLPTSIIYCSIPLREAFQLLLVNFCSLIFLKIGHFNKTNIKNILFIFILSYLLASLHYSFLFSSIIMFSIVLYFNFYDRLRSKVLNIFLFVFSVYAGVSLFNNIFSMMYEAELYEALQRFNDGSSSANSRGTYRLISELNSSSDLLVFITYSFFQYMLEPLPTRIGNFKDLLSFFENFSRLLLLVIGIYNLKKYKFFRPQFIIIFYFLIIELIWSVGTTNWGTASRHHIPSLGILSILGFMLPNDFYKKIVK